MLILLFFDIGFKKRVLKELSALKYSVAKILERLEGGGAVSLEKLCRSTNEKEYEYNSYLKTEVLPLKSLYEVKEFELKLKDKEEKLKLVSNYSISPPFFHFMSEWDMSDFLSFFIYQFFNILLSKT